MNSNQLGIAAPSGGIRFGTHKFDTQFLRRHWIKVVIQERPTGRHWESRGVWTSDFQKATSFDTCTAALEHATHLKLSNVQLVLTREQKQYGVIPLKTSVKAQPTSFGERTADRTIGALVDGDAASRLPE